MGWYPNRSQLSNNSEPQANWPITTSGTRMKVKRASQYSLSRPYKAKTKLQLDTKDYLE